MVDGDDAELEEEDLLTSRGCKQGVYSCTAAADVLWVAGAGSPDEFGGVGRQCRVEEAQQAAERAPHREGSFPRHTY